MQIGLHEHGAACAVEKYVERKTTIGLAHFGASPVSFSWRISLRDAGGIGQRPPIHIPPKARHGVRFCRGRRSHQHRHMPSLVCLELSALDLLTALAPTKTMDASGRFLSRLSHFGQSLFEKLREDNPDVSTGAGGRLKVLEAAILSPSSTLFLSNDSFFVDLRVRHGINHWPRARIKTKVSLNSGEEEGCRHQFVVVAGR